MNSVYVLIGVNPILTGTKEYFDTDNYSILSFFSSVGALRPMGDIEVMMNNFRGNFTYMVVEEYEFGGYAGYINRWWYEWNEILEQYVLLHPCGDSYPYSYTKPYAIS